MLGGRDRINLELESEFSKAFLKTVSAFANYDGGTILFGVDDFGCVVGVGDLDDLCLRVENSINDAIAPFPVFA